MVLHPPNALITFVVLVVIDIAVEISANSLHPLMCIINVNWIHFWCLRLFCLQYEINHCDLRKSNLNRVNRYFNCSHLRAIWNLCVNSQFMVFVSIRSVTVREHTLFFPPKIALLDDATRMPAWQQSIDCSTWFEIVFTFVCFCKISHTTLFCLMQFSIRSMSHSVGDYRLVWPTDWI